MSFSWFELKIPPPIVVLSMGCLHWMAVWISPNWAQPMPLWLSLGAVIFALFFGFMGVFGCLQEKTTIHPWNPEETECLVTTGVFSISRNPMYLALILLLFAWVTQPLHPLSLLALWGSVGYLFQFQIRPEERILAAKFPQQFAEYAGRVPRWI